jgi:hypothetical protein
MEVDDFPIGTRNGGSHRRAWYFPNRTTGQHQMTEPERVPRSDEVRDANGQRLIHDDTVRRLQMPCLKFVPIA